MCNEEVDCVIVALAIYGLARAYITEGKRHVTGTRIGEVITKWAKLSGIWHRRSREKWGKMCPIEFTPDSQCYGAEFEIRGVGNMRPE